MGLNNFPNEQGLLLLRTLFLFFTGRGKMSETRKLGKESKCVCWVWQDGGPDFQKQLVGGSEIGASSFGIL